MSVLEGLTEDEKYLIAILEDESGVDQAEFLWSDETRDDGVFRCYDYQVAWYRAQDKFQIDQCFPAGSLVLTGRGQVPIEGVQVGDQVLTHEGRWRPVTAVFDRGEQDLVSVRGNGHYGLRTTSDHELYVRKYRRRRKVELDQPVWAPVGGLETGAEAHHKWATPRVVDPVPLPVIEGAYHAGQQNSLRDEHLDNIYLWFLVGLYVAEGSVSSSFGHGGGINRVTFSVNNAEVPAVTSALEMVGFRFRSWVNDNVTNIVVNSTTLARWLVEMCGRGAGEKFLHPSIFSQCPKARGAVLDGMVFGDGHRRPRKWDGVRWRGGDTSYTTVSRRLAFDLRILAATLDIQASVAVAREAGEGNILGRSVNLKECYAVSLNESPAKRRAIFLGDHSWSRVLDVQPVGRAKAYDLEVAEDHSYVVEGVVAHNCARAVGKSVGIQLRAFAFGFNYPGEEMLITAPELIHLDPVTRYIEDRLLAVRLSREMLAADSKTSGIRHRPFEVKYKNGSKIVGRIPQKDGKGIKGMHPKKLEMDEAQDYPEQGWIELTETLKYGQAGSSWRAHGVTRGVRDYFYKLTQPESGWSVHRITAMHRPDWTEQERRQKAEVYGGRHAPDYRRNILGQHGDAQNPLFVLTRLMACVDSNQGSTYNTNEYLHMRITHERVVERGGDIATLLEFPLIHRSYERTWVGMDVGMTNHPTEILIFGEVARKNTGKAFVKDGMADPDVRLKAIARVHLERISAPDQRAVLKAIYDHYKPRAMAMDKTGLGLPIYQEVINGNDKGLAHAMRGYNFSEKIVVGYEEMPDDVRVDDIDDYAILANVLEYSSDTLRLLVDRQQLILPWDVEMLREFQGQTYVVKRSTTNPYGKKQFNQGKFHTLDAARMAALAFSQEMIEAMRPQPEDFEPVLDAFVM